MVREVTVPVIRSKNVSMNKGFRDTAIWTYSCKIVDKKVILRTVCNTGIYCSSDKVGTVYNKFSKIPPSTSRHFATSVRIWHLPRLRASWSCSLRATTSIMWSSSSSRVSTFLLHTPLFIQPHKQKSNAVKSGDLGGQLIVLPRPIHRLGKVSMRCFLKSRV